MRSILLPLRPVGRPAEPCTTALQAGRNTTTLFMARLCSLAEPTGPAQVCPAYLYMVSPGREVFQHPARPSTARVLPCLRPCSPPLPRGWVKCVREVTDPRAAPWGRRGILTMKGGER